MLQQLARWCTTPTFAFPKLSAGLEVHLLVFIALVFLKVHLWSDYFVADSLAAMFPFLTRFAVSVELNHERHAARFWVRALCYASC